MTHILPGSGQQVPDLLLVALAIVEPKRMVIQMIKNDKINLIEKLFLLHCLMIIIFNSYLNAKINLPTWSQTIVVSHKNMCANKTN